MAPTRALLLVLAGMRISMTKLSTGSRRSGPCSVTLKAATLPPNSSLAAGCPLEALPNPAPATCAGSFCRCDHGCPHPRAWNTCSARPPRASWIRQPGDQGLFLSTLAETAVPAPVQSWACMRPLLLLSQSQVLCTVSSSEKLGQEYSSPGGCGRK